VELYIQKQGKPKEELRELPLFPDFDALQLAKGSFIFIRRYILYRHPEIYLLIIVK